MLDGRGLVETVTISGKGKNKRKVLHTVNTAGRIIIQLHCVTNNLNIQTYIVHIYFIETPFNRTFQSQC